MTSAGGKILCNQKYLCNNNNRYKPKQKQNALQKTFLEKTEVLKEVKIKVLKKSCEALISLK